MNSGKKVRVLMSLVMLLGFVLLMSLSFAQEAPPPGAPAAAEQAAPAPAPIDPAAAAKAEAAKKTVPFTQGLLDQLGDAKVAADTVWTLIAAMLVFFMNLGFAMVETG